MAYMTITDTVTGKTITVVEEIGLGNKWDVKRNVLVETTPGEEVIVLKGLPTRKAIRTWMKDRMKERGKDEQL